MSNPLVSVIVATYRRKQMLKEALQSLLMQDYRPLEIIVVDDNGADDWNQEVQAVVQEAQQLLSDEQTFKLIVNDHQLGSASSRDAGIAVAKGSYITFLDDDDVYLPQKISEQLSLMQHAEADYSLMDLMLFNENTLSLSLKTHPYLLKGDTSQAALLRWHLMYHLTGTDAMMFRRDYLLQLGGFGSIDIGDEFYLMMKAIERGGRFSYLPKALAKACVHYDGSGLSGGPLKIEGENALFAFKKSYFTGLSRKDTRYVRMRHHAVLAFARFRLKHPFPFLQQVLYGFLSSPSACYQLMLEQLKK